MKKILYILLCAALITGSFAGCASGGENNQAEEAAPEKQRLEIAEPEKIYEEPEEEIVTENLIFDVNISEELRIILESGVIITDINDWEKLELGYYDRSAEYFEWYRDYILAFLTNDTAKLEEKTGLSHRSSGAYDIYNTLEFGKYKITAAPDPMNDHLRFIYFYVEIISSGVALLPAGNYLFYIQQGMIPGHFNQSVEHLSTLPRNQIATPAQAALNKWLGRCINLTFYNHDDSDRALPWYAYDITDYIFMATETGFTGGLTFEQIQEYALKYFGIDDFIPPDGYLWEGLYYLSARGGEIRFYEFLDETEENGITTLTVKFFADPSRTVQSHIIEYKMQALDVGYKLIGSEIIYESQFMPWHTSV